jgi:hypothetical protein
VSMKIIFGHGFFSSLALTSGVSNGISKAMCRVCLRIPV